MDQPETEAEREARLRKLLKTKVAREVGRADIRLQLAKMIIGAFGGLALLVFFLVALQLGVKFEAVERVAIIATAVTGFGLALHGALKSPPPGGGQ